MGAHRIQRTEYRAAGASSAALVLGGSATLKLHFVLPGFRPKSPICNLISETALQTLPRPPYGIGRDDVRAVARGFQGPGAEPSRSAGQTAGAMPALPADVMAGALPVVRALALAGWLDDARPVAAAFLAAS